MTALMTLPPHAAEVLSWLLKDTLILAIAFIATLLLRRRSAGARHLLWMAAIAAILVLPILSMWAPRLPVRVLPAEQSTLASSDEQTPTLSIGRELALSRPRIGRAEREPEAWTSSLGTMAPDAAARTTGSWTFSLLSSGAALIALWGVVALALVVWLAFGMLSVRRIVAGARPLESPIWSTAACEIADRLDLDELPRLVASTDVEMPFACGILHPTIVLPESADGWTEQRRRSVLFHELAHIRRRDLVGHTLGRIACALYWFHPLVWRAARRLRAESERACDDLVLACGTRASDYADHLLDIVISVRRHGAPAPALPMARRRELEGRVLAILDPAVRRAAPGRLQAVSTMAALALLACVIAAAAPMPRTVPHPHLATIARATRDTVASRVESQRSQPPARTAHASTSASEPQQPQLLSSALPAREVQRIVQSTAIALHQDLRMRELPRVPAAGPAQPQDSSRAATLARVLRTDSDADVRRTAAWGLSEHTDLPFVQEALRNALRTDADARVREMAAWALQDTRSAAALGTVADALRRDDDSRVRETSAWVLGEASDHLGDDTRQALVAALGDSSGHVRATAAWALGQEELDRAPAALPALLADRDRSVRLTAAWALGEIGDSSTVPAIAAAFDKETDDHVREAELRAIMLLGGNAPQVIEHALASSNPALRARAVRMLSGVGDWPWPWPQPRPRPMP